MAEHSKERKEISAAFGNEPDDVFGKPEEVKAPKAKAEGFQEEIPSVADLLGDIAPPAVAPAAGVEEEVIVDVPTSDIDTVVVRLQTIIDAEGTAVEDKTSAEEMVARLEELKTALSSAEEFLTEKETVVAVEENVEVV